jgi:formylglycine-generating enzyme required for sulfatase activity
VEPAGSRPGCTNDFGVFDMNGNVQEFTEYHPPFHVEYRGGAEDEGPGSSRCNSGNATWSDDATHRDIGIRCCMTP